MDGRPLARELTPRTILMDHAPFTPFMEKRTAHPPGISPLEPADWFVFHPDYARQMAYRAEILDTVPEIVLGETPDAVPAIAELYDAVLTHLTATEGFRVGPDAVTRPDGETVALDRAAGLDTLGRLVADDLCLLEKPEGSAEYRLSAAVLCFPSRWLLSEKLGRPLTVIHDPVPDYDETLARRVNRMFEAIRPGKPLVRVNWLVHASPQLHLPLGSSDKLVAQSRPEDGLYLRTERQTLTRLPQTGAVVFGIKTSICPLSVLAPDQARMLRVELAGLPPASLAYRAGADLAREADRQLTALSSPEERTAVT